MAKLLYTATMSLDGYVEDVQGSFEWGAPDESRFAFINDLVRPIGTFLFGRRMYETMVYWETADAIPDQPAAATDFQNIWLAADKVVYSKTLATVSSAKTRIERDFDPEGIRRMKASARRDLNVGGAELAAQAIAAGLVDEYHLFVVPVVLGGGKRSLPSNVRAKLELIDERRFGDGSVYLHYRGVA